MATRYNVEGTVYNEDGSPAGNRAVHIYDRSTGDKIQSLVTEPVTGKFRANYYHNKEMFVVAMPNPQDGSNAKVFDRVVPVVSEVEVNVNNIGQPGQLGFGVGIAPVVPSFMVALDGTTNINSINYGNYKCTIDDSIMVWIPAFWYKWGNGSNGFAMNEPSIVQFSTYSSHAAAAVDGYVLHRAFIDGGDIKAGVFVDKYMNSKHPTLNMVSSHQYRNPISCSSNSNSLIVDPMAYVSVAFNGETNTASSVINIARFRGNGFHNISIFTNMMIYFLAYAHSYASTSTTNNAWYQPSPQNWVKGYNYSNGGSVEDLTVRGCNLYLSSVYTYYTGVGNNVAKCNHNGQLSGVNDVAGNLSEVGLGAFFSTNFYILKESVKMSDLVYNTSSANHVLTASNYDSLGTTMSDYETYTATTTVSATRTKQMWNPTTDRTSTDYKYLSMGVMIAGNVSSSVSWGNSNTNPIGDLGHAHRKDKGTNSIPWIGGAYDQNGRGSLFSQRWTFSATSSNYSIGIRTALYV